MRWRATALQCKDVADYILCVILSGELSQTPLPTDFDVHVATSLAHRPRHIVCHFARLPVRLYGRDPFATLSLV